MKDTEEFNDRNIPSFFKAVALIYLKASNEDLDQCFKSLSMLMVDNKPTDEETNLKSTKTNQ